MAKKIVKHAKHGRPSPVHHDSHGGMWSWSGGSTFWRNLLVGKAKRVKRKRRG